MEKVITFVEYIKSSTPKFKLFLAIAVLAFVFPFRFAAATMWEGVSEVYRSPGIDQTQGSVIAALNDVVAASAIGETHAPATACAGETLEVFTNPSTQGQIDYSKCKYSPTDVTAQNTVKNSTMLAVAMKSGTLIESGDLMPIDSAYAFRRQIEKVPVVGDRAYAQASTVYTNLFLADFVYYVWVIFRNLAYGLLSVFLIIIGIMIMTRRKADPKTVVTLQAALPKVVIALILITFSFPIGATAASFIGPLRKFSAQILQSVSADTAINLSDKASTSISDLPMLGVMMILGIIGTSIPLISLFLAFATSGILIAYLVAVLIAFFKTIIIYFKVLASIVYSPMVFAVEAIPGNEGMAVAWFKTLAARIIAIPAMYFVLGVATRLPYWAVNAQLLGPNLTGYQGTLFSDVTFGIFQQFFLILILPFMVIIVLFSAIQVPGKVEAMIMGPKRR